MRVLFLLHCLKLSVAGQERYQSISASYFRGCDGVCLVYDKTNYKSFEGTKYSTCFVNNTNLKQLHDG